MALMSSFFKGKKKKTSTPSEKISLDELSQLIPIRSLSQDKLESFVLDHGAEIVSKGEIIFKINDISNIAVYLLKGTVELADDNGQSYEVSSTDLKSKFPLSSGLKFTTTAKAKSEVRILRVSQRIMNINSDSAESMAISIPENLKSNNLLQSFAQSLADNELEVPSLPSVAIQLRKAMKSEIGIDQAVQIIQLDPVISAKLIEVANCPLYISINPAKSCFEAVQRIGLIATRNLVVSLSIKNIFSSTSPVIKKYLDKEWKKSIYLSSLCFTLAAADKQVNPEEALLAGLIADIGVIPFLNFTAKLPEDFYNKEEIEQAIPVIKGVVGSIILKKWGFAEEFIQVPLLSDDWFQHTSESISYIDIVVLSKLHTKIGHKSASTPSITSIPAASKLKFVNLSPENSLSILHDAKDKINETLKFFST